MSLNLNLLSKEHGRDIDSQRKRDNRSKSLEEAVVFFLERYHFRALEGMDVDLHVAMPRNKPLRLVFLSRVDINTVSG